MIEIIWLRWLLGLLFICAGLYSGYRVIQPERPILRYCHIWHLLMCLGMMAMIWPWGMVIPVTPQVVLFCIATLWFLWLGISGGCCSENDPHRNRTRLSMGYHALMMIAMAWMLIDMNAHMQMNMTMSRQADVSVQSHDNMPMHSDMDMSTQSHADMPMPSKSDMLMRDHDMGSTTSWLGYAWMIVFSISSIYYLVQTLYRLISYRQGISLGEPGSQFAMALGMLTMIGVMA